MTELEIYGLIEHIAAYSVSIPIFFILFRFKALNRTLWALFLYLLLCIASDQISLAFSGEEKNVNLILNCFTLCESFFLAFIYYQQLTEKRSKHLLILALGTIIAFAIKIFVFEARYNKVDNSVSTIEAAIFIAISGLHLYKMAVDPGIVRLRRFSFYWINLAFMLYFTAALLLFKAGDFISEATPIIARLLWGIHDCVAISCNILLSIGIWNTKLKQL